MSTQSGYFGIGTNESITTDDTITETLRYDLGGLSSNSGIVIGNFVVLCRHVSTNSLAYWKQQVGIKFTNSVAQFIQFMYTKTTPFRDCLLTYTDLTIELDGKNVVVNVKGLPGTTLVWSISFDLEIVQTD